MAKIPMTQSEFQVCPEGTHIFQITAVEYDENFGILKVHMVTENGIKHSERFSLMNADGTANDKAMNAFSFFAKAALNNFSLTEIEETDLIGHYIECEVTHVTKPNRNDPTKTVTFAQLGKKTVATGFTGGAAPATAPKVAVDLDSLLD